MVSKIDTGLSATQPTPQKFEGRKSIDHSQTDNSMQRGHMMGSKVDTGLGQKEDPYEITS